jgi:hypothetical protein
LDHAAEENRAGLIKAIVSELEDDPVYQNVAMMMTVSPGSLVSKVDRDPSLMFLKEIGILESWTQTSDAGVSRVHLRPLENRLRSYLGSRTRKCLMALVYSCSHFHAPLVLAGLFAGRLKACDAKEELERSAGQTWPFAPKDCTRKMADLALFAASAEDREIVLKASGPALKQK